MRAYILTCFIGLGLLHTSPASAQSIGKAGKMATQATQTFYGQTPDKQVWADDARYADLMTALSGLADHGLNPEHYGLAELGRLQADKTARDKLATSAWLTAAAHMIYGKLDPVSVEPDWTVAGRQIDLVAALTETLQNGDVASSLAKLAPKQPGYGILVSEYARLRALAATPMTIVPAGETLKSGMKSSRVITLQNRLTELGYLSLAQTSGIMDTETVQAIKAFQIASDLDDDGAVGPATLNTLNRNVDKQVQQVRVNLERWRWLPDDLGRRHLRANIAGFDVSAWNGGTRERTHLTIVGKAYRQTPVFSDEVEYAIFNPWWETPTSITLRDKLPLFRKDPAAVERSGFHILDRNGGRVDASSIDWANVSPGSFPYRIRQAPGDANALGKVKIIFPNVHNVYLHDTPTRGLFAQRQRAFSSGCLRTQDPIELSKWLLSETPDWPSERVDAAVASGKETRANLTVRVPVHILYFTVVNDDSGTVRYLDDIYSRDQAVLTGLTVQLR